MADVDPNLVRAIAEHVMAALRGMQGPPATVGGGGGQPRAEVHAPIGICTGDYSKFQELQHLRGAPPQAASQPVAAPVAPALHVEAPLPPSAAPQASAVPAVSVAAPPVSPPTPRPVGLKGVITAENLKRIKGPVVLAKGAMLTPLAQDYIREKNLTVMTDEAAAPERVLAGAAAASAPMFWWIDGQCSSVAKVTEALRPNLWAAREISNAERLKAVVKELAQLVRNKKVCGGLLFVNSAARAACYANRCPSLRAVVGTNDAAVSECVELLGANVLVIEYPQHGFKSMMAMVERFAPSCGQVPPAVQRELDELRNCG